MTPTKAHYATSVIPAQAGIHSLLTNLGIMDLDARVRGHDDHTVGRFS